MKNKKTMMVIVFLLIIAFLLLLFPTLSCTDSPDNNTVTLSEAHKHSVTWLRIVTIRSPEITNKTYWLETTPDVSPLTIYDIRGKPNLYEFNIIHSGSVVGTLTVSGQRTLGGPLYAYNLDNRVYPAREQLITAERFLSERYPATQIHSIKYVWDDSKGLMIEGKIQNVTSNTVDTINLSAYELQEIESLNNAGFGEKDPPSEREIKNNLSDAMISQWEEGAKDSEELWEFARAENIDLAAPMSSHNAYRIQEFLINNSIDVPERLPPGIFDGADQKHETGKPCTSNEAWHSRADQIGAWNAGILVNESLSDDEIISILKEYDLRISRTEPPALPHYIGYYLEIPDEQYESITNYLEKNDQMNLSFSAPSYTFLQFSNKKYGNISRLPVFLHKSNYMNESENYANLRNKTIPVHQTKVVIIETETGKNSQERERILTTLNNDERILFVFKEYLEGVLC